MDELHNLKQMVLSKDLEESVLGIDRLVKLTDTITDIYIEAILSSTDRFITIEKGSLLFQKYLSKLKIYLKSDDKDLAFWMASLIVHYNINDDSAKAILLNAIKYDELSKAYTATTILGKNQHVKFAIMERLKDDSLSNQAKEFFREKLQEWQ